MQKIREWMEQNPDGANELRRQNRSYVFFREVKLSDKDEAVGAQGVPLTPGRSIAVDKALHVYGTPFFIEGELPIEIAAVKDAVPPPDDRAGHRLGHRRPRARRSLFRRRRGGRQGRRPHPPQCALRHAGAEEPRSGRARPQAAGAGCAAVGDDRKAVPAGRSAELREGQAPEVTAATSTSAARRNRQPPAARAFPDRRHPGRRGETGAAAGGRGQRQPVSQSRVSVTSAAIASPDETPAAESNPELPMPPRRKRGLSEEDRALWESVAKQVKPLRKRHRAAEPHGRAEPARPKPTSRKDRPSCQIMSPAESRPSKPQRRWRR